MDASVDFLTFQYKLMASNEFSNNVFECADVGVPCNGNDVLRTLGIDVVPPSLDWYAAFWPPSMLLL